MNSQPVDQEWKHSFSSLNCYTRNGLYKQKKQGLSKHWNQNFIHYVEKTTYDLLGSWQKHFQRILLSQIMSIVH